MNQNLSWEIQLALAAVIGLVIGLLVMWLMMRTSRSKEKEHEELVQKFQNYRQEVDKHLVDTAAAVDELNRSYQKVIQHLSSGAQKLMGKEALQEQLANRSNKAVTVAYLAATATAGAATLPQESDFQDGNIVPPSDDLAFHLSDIDPVEQVPVSEVPVTDLPHTTAVATETPAAEVPAESQPAQKS